MQAFGDCHEGAVCQWHTLSADRSGAKTAVCQWHTLSADRSGAKTKDPVACCGVFDYSGS